MADLTKEYETLGRIKKEVLEDLRDKIVRDLQPEKMFAFLRSKRILDEEDCEEITSERTRRKRSEAFLDVIGKKGQEGFDYFCEAFVRTGKTQLHLLNDILDLIEDKIYDDKDKPMSVCQHNYEVINAEVLNNELPKPGETGAPCLPSYTSLATQDDTLLSQLDRFSSTISFTPPPPYSEY